MNRCARRSLAALGLLLIAGTPAAALVIGGGGSKTTDCLLALSVDANHPPTRPRQVRCTDGDPACDDDGVVNGVCALRVAACANSTHDPACTIAGLASVTVEHALDNGDPRFDPDFQALQTRLNSELDPPVLTADTCTTPTIVRVPIKGPLGRNVCRRQKKTLRLRALSTAGPDGTREDKDTLKLMCSPAPVGGCDPQTLFAGTFDRIQRQIFNQSCALSGCHDSQSQAGDLLLEIGAAYGNLVNQSPANFSAFTAGWSRVAVVPGVSGDRAASFLLRKVEGDLPDANYGERMPLGGRRLHATLRGLLAAWIDAGAPATGWVPGTD